MVHCTMPDRLRFRGLAAKVVHAPIECGLLSLTVSRHGRVLESGPIKVLPGASMVGPRLFDEIGNKLSNSWRTARPGSRAQRKAVLSSGFNKLDLVTTEISRYAGSVAAYA